MINLEGYFCSDCIYSKKIDTSEPNRECTYPPYAKKVKGKRFYAGWNLTAVMHSLGLQDELALIESTPKRLCYSQKEEDPLIKKELHLIWGAPNESRSA